MKELGFFSRLWYWLSPSYRREVLKKQKKERYNAMLLKGKHLWEEINQKLPKAHGVLEDDVPRMEAFEKLKQTLSSEEKSALRIWLKFEIDDLENNFCELTSGLQEEYERRYLQIYNQHLAALNNTVWPPKSFWS